MAAMLTSLHRGGGERFFNWANSWRTMPTADPDTRMMVDVRPHDPDGGKVPEAFTVNYAMDGGDTFKEVFENV
ncbi:hypothetical protein SAMN05216281_101136 [Cryobacterium luteum]|nr:hypothetical protein SAMN05216281_101136 [Cryobacterium luteum]